MLGPVQVPSPSPALGNWGLFICYFQAVLTRHSLNALPFPGEEEGGQKMRNGKVLSIFFCLFLSLGICILGGIWTEQQLNVLPAC